MHLACSFPRDMIVCIGQVTPFVARHAKSGVLPMGAPSFRPAAEGSAKSAADGEGPGGLCGLRSGVSRVSLPAARCAAAAGAAADTADTADAALRGVHGSSPDTRGTGGEGAVAAQIFGGGQGFRAAANA